MKMLTIQNLVLVNGSSISDLMYKNGKLSETLIKILLLLNLVFVN